MAANTRSQTAARATARPVSILFVCLGNICRSPMAEGTFRHLTNFSAPSQHSLIAHVDSCGTGAYHAGDQPDSRTLSVLEEQAGITSYRHKARRIKIPNDLLEYDYILAMDEDNMIDLRDMIKRAKKKGLLNEEQDVAGKVRLYGEFGGQGREEVQDPYYGGRNGFEVAYEQVERFGRGLLRHIEEKAKSGDGAADGV